MPSLLPLALGVLWALATPAVVSEAQTRASQSPGGASQPRTVRTVSARPAALRTPPKVRRPAPSKLSPRLRSYVNQVSASYSISDRLVLAVIQVESGFDATAISPTGALGLMQLMPATAKLTARRHRVAYSHKGDLLTPSVNMQLGMAHVSDLLENFAGS